MKWFIVVFVIVFAVIFIPIPHKVGQVNCMPCFSEESCDSSCPNPDDIVWGPSIAQVLFSFESSTHQPPSVENNF